jgi:hypothetical protein
MRKSPTTITVKRLLIAAVRWIADFLVLELMIHFLYVVAINKAKAWKSFTPYELGVVAFLNLKHIWLKVRKGSNERCLLIKLLYLISNLSLCFSPLWNSSE